MSVSYVCCVCVDWCAFVCVCALQTWDKPKRDEAVQSVSAGVGTFPAWLLSRRLSPDMNIQRRNHLFIRLRPNRKGTDSVGVRKCWMLLRTVPLCTLTRLVGDYQTLKQSVTFPELYSWTLESITYCILRLFSRYAIKPRPLLNACLFNACCNLLFVRGE